MNTTVTSLISVDKLFHRMGRSQLLVHLQEEDKNLSNERKERELTDWYKSTVHDGSPQIEIPTNAVQNTFLAVKGRFMALNQINK